MLPKNESLRKILVVFSFFETFCTRVGNSERFGQGKPSLSYFFLSDFSRWCDGGCGGVENVVIWTFGRLLDGGRRGGWKCQGVNWTSPLPCILASLPRLGIFRQADMQTKPLAGRLADLFRSLHIGAAVLLRWRWRAALWWMCDWGRCGMQGM